MSLYWDSHTFISLPLAYPSGILFWLCRSFTNWKFQRKIILWFILQFISRSFHIYYFNNIQRSHSFLMSLYWDQHTFICLPLAYPSAIRFWLCCPFTIWKFQRKIILWIILQFTSGSLHLYYFNNIPQSHSFLMSLYWDRPTFICLPLVYPSAICFWLCRSFHNMKIPEKNNTLNYITIYFWFITSLLFQQYPTEPNFLISLYLDSHIFICLPLAYPSPICFWLCLSFTNLKFQQKNNTLPYFSIFFFGLLYLNTQCSQSTLKHFN
jgi:hypothetical protein